MPYQNTNSNKKKFPWMAQIRVNGKKKRKQFRTKKEAIIWENQQRVEEQSRTHIPSLHEWAKRYLQFSEREFVNKTFLEKKLAFKYLLNNSNVDPDSPAECLSTCIVLDHLQEQAENRSGNSANKDRKNLAAAWKWGVKFISLPRLNPIVWAGKM